MMDCAPISPDSEKSYKYERIARSLLYYSTGPSTRCKVWAFRNLGGTIVGKLATSSKEKSYHPQKTAHTRSPYKGAQFAGWGRYDTAPHLIRTSKVSTYKVEQLSVQMACHSNFLGHSDLMYQSAHAWKHDTTAHIPAQRDILGRLPA